MMRRMQLKVDYLVLWQVQLLVLVLVLLQEVLFYLFSLLLV